MVLLILLLLARPAAAQEDERVERAKDLFRQGYELAVEEKWAEALEKLEASRALIERPSTLFNIGTALLRLARPSEAIAAFERYLELTSPEDPGRAEATSFLEQARGSVAVLQIQVTPPEAEVTVDGRRVDPMQSIIVDPGTRVIAASAPGFSDRSISVEVTAKETRQVALELSAVPPEAPPLPPPPAAEPPPVLVTKAKEIESIAIAEEEESFAGSVTFWVLIGAGVAVVGGAIAVGLAVRSGEEDPYPGTLNTVLEGLHTR
jgi:hypothetical protein